MLVKIKNNEGNDDNEYRDFYSIDASRENSFLNLEFADGEVEDGNLSRSFSAVYNIMDLVKMAYEAGKAGEQLDVVDVEDDDSDRSY